MADAKILLTRRSKLCPYPDKTFDREEARTISDERKSFNGFPLLDHLPWNSCPSLKEQI
jgi:hypothetical protein